MEANAVDPKVLERIQQIRALADAAGTPGEAAAAPGKLSELLVKTGLSIMDLDLHAKKSNRKVVKADVLLYSYRYLHLLYGHVAAAFNCRAIVGPQTKKNYAYLTLVGHDHNIVVVQDMAQWLVTLVDKMCNKAWRDLGNVERIKYSESSWKRAYKIGFVDAVGTSLAGAVEQIAKDDEKLYALVPVIEQEVTDKVEELFSKVRDLPATKPVNSKAYHKGKKDGESVDVTSRQRGESAEVPQIG